MSVQLQDGRLCSVAGVLSAGGNCTHLTTGDKNTLSFSEMLEFLSPQPDRVCVPVDGMNVCKEDQSTGTPVTLSARGAALAMSPDDTKIILTELAVMCRALGKNCSRATQASIQRIQAMLQ